MPERHYERPWRLHGYVCSFPKLDVLSRQCYLGYSLAALLGEVSGRVVPRAGEWSPDERAGWVLFGVPDQTAVLVPLRGALLLRLRCALVGVFLG